MTDTRGVIKNCLAWARTALIPGSVPFAGKKTQTRSGTWQESRNPFRLVSSPVLSSRAENARSRRGGN
jgi:hypothetical protein